MEAFCEEFNAMHEAWRSPRQSRFTMCDQVGDYLLLAAFVFYLLHYCIMAPLGLYLLLHRHHSDTFHPYVKKKEFLWQNRGMQKLTSTQKLKTSMLTITKIYSLNSGFYI